MDLIREFQISKVYAAERLWWKEQNFKTDMSLREINDVLYKMLPAFQYRIDVGDGRSRTSACGGIDGYGRADLRFPKWSRHMAVVCHEAAHVLAWNQGAAHGPQFCRAFIKLVREFMGPEQAARLVYFFQQKRVVFTEAQEAHYLKASARRRKVYAVVC
jgi:hypothetical protein